ncbi:hypothetical protein I8920_00920 [Curtobacterium sp. YC1]|uniref:hypothetical protein n=1 Tax=Curtobacterium sp. YC1 TaxID=2795488 RepID=UPI0018E5A22C|nr:hypothetical protein [Curtobacterium sp. YC1]QQD76372.1 hypothetical protein I8920_00920 [Curtobacterium sp. YC1]
MTREQEQLARVQDIATRARQFDRNEPSDPKAFAATIVADLGELADAVAELIKRAD